MKKTTKKLQLHRLTIANLTTPALELVVGGGAIIHFDHNYNAATQTAAVQSVKVDTRIEPCQ